ncbi:PPOX class F420-dependent oxidoreductase [Luteipulveratus mongoliensis]|uniref:Pyridoxamine 5'-phosphate oxidase N-terminal domain-containing protein n=1 Tax=Luteipulveratus mongoliensis TaxID=571913 RepID=A0A0K1JG58_9MICO|nr:PPOX class F420-dependent oxidoreductase [Luteipulveratus mongoliensis]AKU15573.1 hypothetical protein VV02_06380 [Luteipulveratus mongoliensis]
MSDEALRTILSGSDLAVLATIKQDGRPQLSNVGYTFDAERDVLRVSVTDSRAKVANLRRDARATVLIQGDGRWKFAVAEVRAELFPVCTSPDDASVNELVDIYRTISGEHPEWDEFRQAMINDHRLPLHLHVERLYGMAG